MIRHHFILRSALLVTWIAASPGIVLADGPRPFPAADPCLPCRGTGGMHLPGTDENDLLVDVHEVRPLGTNEAYTAILLEVGGELYTIPSSYDPVVLDLLEEGLLDNILIPDFYLYFSRREPANLVFGRSSVECGGAGCDCGEHCITILRKRIDFLGCRRFDDRPDSCVLNPGCVYYPVSGQCHPEGTSDCDAGDLDACTCRRLDNDPTECAMTIGCDYFESAAECHPEGTLLCNTGYAGPECSTCRRYDGDARSCVAFLECIYDEGVCLFKG